LPDLGNGRREQVIIGFLALSFLLLPEQVIMGRESTRDVPLSLSADMKEDIILVDNILNASPRRFNLRLKVWHKGSLGNQEERYTHTFYFNSI